MWIILCILFFVAICSALFLGPPTLPACSGGDVHPIVVSCLWRLDGIRIHNRVQRIWRTQRTTATTINSQQPPRPPHLGSRAGLPISLSVARCCLALMPGPASPHRCYADLGGSRGSPGLGSAGSGAGDCEHLSLLGSGSDPRVWRSRSQAVQGWLLSEWAGVAEAAPVDTQSKINTRAGHN